MFDIIFFIYLADEDYMRRIGAEKPQRPDFNKLKEEWIRDRQILHDFLITDKSKKLTQERERRTAVILPLMSSPLLMERLPAYEFMVSHLDLFAHYTPINPTPGATYFDYGPMFMNLYNFLNTLRAEMLTSVGDPHEYVVQKLEGCLEFTETIAQFTPEHANTVCKLSHRKYAEMYYFYKAYLLEKSKPAAGPLTPYADRTFDTHVRLFINFAQAESRHLMTEECGRNSKTPICVTWNLFSQLLAYLHHVNLRSDYLVEVVRALDWANPSTNFHVLGALESVYYNAEHSNIKEYSKLLGLIEAMSASGVEILNFGPSDVPALALYLKRTYRKLIFSKQEEHVAQAVREILASSTHSDLAQDFFGTFLVFGDVVYLDYIKLFLLLASTDAEYTRIAEVIVKAKGGKTLIRLNDEQTHFEYSSFIGGLFAMNLPMNKRLEAIRNFIKGKFETKYRTCSSALDNILDTQLDFLEGLGVLEDLRKLEKVQTAKSLEKEDEAFQKLAEKVEVKEEVKAPFIVEQLVKIERTTLRRTKSLLLDDFELSGDTGVLIRHQSDFNDHDEKEGSETTVVDTGFLIDGKRMNAPEGFELAGQLNAMMEKALKNAKHIGKKKAVTAVDVSTTKANDILGKFMEENQKAKETNKLKLNLKPNTDGKKAVI